MITIHDVEQGTEAWHQLRAGKYTGSNAHKLLRFGARPEALTETTDFQGSFWTARGHLLEDECIEIYEAVTGETVARPGFVTNSKFPMAGYSPDGLTATHVIEVKCFDEPKHMKVYQDGATFEILAQTHFGTLICERPAARLLIYCPRIKDAKVAFKKIDIPAKRAIHANFKRLLKATPEKVGTGGNTQ